jgi:glycine cleavage system H protein
MAHDKVISYKRSRFSTRLPTDRLYAPSHFWMLECEPGVWRIGFTKFATRMLGDFVELGFDVKPGDPIAIGQEIGWVEGFKARSDIYGAMASEFIGVNPALSDDITLTDTDPYGRGWLYSVRGNADPNSLDVQGYTELLDLTITRCRTTCMTRRMTKRTNRARREKKSPLPHDRRISRRRQNHGHRRHRRTPARPGIESRPYQQRPKLRPCRYGHDEFPRISRAGNHRRVLLL